jgi:hypothetical protein
VVDEPVLVFTHSEKIVFFFTVYGGAIMLRTLTVHQFLCGIEPFTANTILAAVGAKVDISLVINLLEEIAHYLLVKLISSADEVVVGNIKTWPGFAKQLADLVSVSLRIFTCGSGGFYDFVPMFICAGEKIGFLPGEQMETVKNIGDDGGVGMAEMGWSIHIIYGCGDVIPGCHRSSLN